jgi:hypothetical protein
MDGTGRSLSARQQEALRMAVEEGYICRAVKGYDIPHAVDGRTVSSLLSRRWIEVDNVRIVEGWRIFRATQRGRAEYARMRNHREEQS